MENKEYLSVEEVAKLLSIHANTVRHMLTEGTMKGYKLSGKKSQWRIKREDVEILKNVKQ